MNIESSPTQNAMQGTIKQSKDHLMMDLKGVGADASELVQVTARATADELASARAKIDGMLGDARSGFEQARLATLEKARGAADTAQHYVVEHPWRMLAASAAVGLVLGALFRNRR